MSANQGPGEMLNEQGVQDAASGDETRRTASCGTGHVGMMGGARVIRCARACVRGPRAGGRVQRSGLGERASMVGCTGSTVRAEARVAGPVSTAQP